MEKSELNLDVIQNFILYITHCGDHGLDYKYKTKIQFTPEELYNLAINYINVDHVDGKDGDE
jgi:hypothetical protein